MTPRRLVIRGGELIRAHPVIFGVLTIWVLAPVAVLLIYAASHGDRLLGPYGSDAFDQLAYLAWIRDEGNHLLASNLWQVTPTPHDYLHPMFVISGLLWRLGLSIQLSYMIWIPIGLLVLFLGFAAYAHHLLPDSRREQSAALALGLFYVTPVLALAVWTGHLNALHRYDLVLVTDDAYAALNLWGFDHTAITIGLMPVFLIACEALLRARRSRTGAIVVAAVAGAVVSWLHPWQGATLLGILAGLFIVKPPRRRYLVLAIPALATALPLLYGFVLSHADPAWRDFQQRTISTGTAPWWALLASFGPLVVLGALGLRRPHADRDWMLVLWVIACAAVYFLVPEFPPHALSGLTLPLAVLAVRGWRALRLPERVPALVAAALALAAILAFTVPEAVYHGQSLRDDFRNTLVGAASRQLLLLSPDQARAIDYVERAPRMGPVLAPWFLSMSVPGMTGRQAYAGHVMWQPPAQIAATGQFFSPDSTGGRRQAILAASSAAYVISDCSVSRPAVAGIARMLRAIRRWGCVTVYERR